MYDFIVVDALAIFLMIIGVLQDMISMARVFGYDWQVALCSRLWQHYSLWHAVKLAANLPEKGLQAKLGIV